MFDDFQQVPFDGNGEEHLFSDNPEPRCPCLLLLDVSQSMAGQKIRELNEGLKTFAEELKADGLARKRVEPAIVTFGPVSVVQPFVTAETFSPPVLTPQGSTPMGAAIERGIELLEARKNEYRENGVAFYRPWIFMLTDGDPTDDVSRASEAIRRGEQSKAFAFFAVGVDGANTVVLQGLSVREPLLLRGLAFREMFQWLSNSMRSVSQSSPGDAVPLANPGGPSGWAEV